MKVYTANITGQRPAVAASIMAGKNTSNSSTRLQRKLPHTKYSSRQLIYTKATRIFLQHQILILYTALLLKGQCGVLLERTSSHRELFLSFPRGELWGVDYVCILWSETVTGGATRRSAGNGFCFVSFFHLTLNGFCNARTVTGFPETLRHVPVWPEDSFKYKLRVSVPLDLAFFLFFLSFFNLSSFSFKSEAVLEFVCETWQIKEPVEVL